MVWLITYAPNRKEGITPWDRGEIKPALAEALKLPQISFPENGNALVPGCGKVSMDCCHNRLFDIEYCTVSGRDTT